jgi:hypothetical protein
METPARKQRRTLLFQALHWQLWESLARCASAVETRALQVAGPGFSNLMMREVLDHSLRHARRAIVAVVGFTVLLIGIALIVLPGPAFVVIPIGLAILAAEFAWARRLLRRVRQRISDTLRNARMKQ